MTRSTVTLAAFAVLGALAVASVPLAAGAAAAADCQATYSGSETDPARVAACHAAQDASSDVSLEMLQLNKQKAVQGAEAPSADSQAVNAQDAIHENEEDVALDEEEGAEGDQTPGEPKRKRTKAEKLAERAAKKEAKHNQQVARQQRLQEIHAQHALKSDTNQLLHLVKIVNKLVQDLTATGQEVPTWVAGYTSWAANQTAAQTLRKQNKANKHPVALDEEEDAEATFDETEEDVALDEEEAAEGDQKPGNKPNLSKAEKEAERADKKQKQKALHAQQAVKAETNKLLHLVKLVNKLVQDLTATGQEVPAWVEIYTSWVAEQTAAQTLRRQNKVAAQKAKKVEKKAAALKDKADKKATTETPETTTTTAAR